MSEMADAFGAEFVDLEEYSFPPELLAKIPAPIAHSYRVLPLRTHPNHCLRIAISDPSDLDALDDLHQLLGCVLEITVADAHQLRQFINKLYPPPIL